MSFGVVVRGLAWWVVVSLWVGTGSLAVVHVGGVWVLGHIWGQMGVKRVGRNCFVWSFCRFSGAWWWCWWWVFLVWLVGFVGV